MDEIKNHVDIHHKNLLKVNEQRVYIFILPNKIQYYIRTV